MPLFKFLDCRSVKPELMDDLTMGGQELTEALRHLRILNRIFNASTPVLYGVKKLWSCAGKPSSLTVVDIGAGSGDVQRRILNWADEHSIQMTIYLIDISEEACHEARQLFTNEPRVIVDRGDLFELSERNADIVVASQFLHHFDDDQIPSVVKKMLSASRIGVVIHDIHRHGLAWLAVWITTRVISRNRYIRHDGPLSVAKGFRSRDWEKLKKNLQPVTTLSYFWHKLFRYSVIIPRMEKGSEQT